MKKILQKIGIAASTVPASLAMSATIALAQVQDTSINPGAGFATNIGSLINALLTFVMVIAALLVFLYLIWGGIDWITSGGDKGKTESARNKITAAIVGLIVLAASYAILLLALNFLGFDGGLSGDDSVFDNIRFINEAS